jgi:phage terminase large subunit-like protein
MFGLRLGDKPKCAIATRPKPTRVLKALLAREGQDLVVSRATSYDNRAHLAPAFFDQVVRRYENTRLGRQELLAQVLDDTPGALWTLARIEELRRDAVPPLRRVVVAIDPSGGEGDDHDEVGIVCCGVDETDHGWVLCDASGHYSPSDWAKAAIQVYRNCGADRIVAEVNYGGAMVESVLRQVDPNIPFTAVHASRGKVARAEPIAALYEQARVHHLGAFPELEDEMSCFTSSGFAGGAPNRVDALVWSLSELMAQPMASFGIYELYRQMAGELTARETALIAAPDPRQQREKAILDERRRFAALMADRPPTPAEAAAHVEEIDRIMTGRHSYA